MSDDIVEVALRKLVYSIAEIGDDEDPTLMEVVDRAVSRVERLETENEELRGEIAELRSQIDAISDIGQEKTTKEEKVASIVVWAQRQARDERKDRVAVKAREIVGVTDVSRRYAYDLIDELPNQYDWMLDRDEIKQYGDLEIDKEGRERALVVDLELLHSDEGAVNKFTTAIASEEGLA